MSLSTDSSVPSSVASVSDTNSQDEETDNVGLAALGDSLALPYTSSSSLPFVDNHLTRSETQLDALGLSGSTGFVATSGGGSGSLPQQPPPQHGSTDSVVRSPLDVVSAPVPDALPLADPLLPFASELPSDPFLPHSESLLSDSGGDIGGGQRSASAATTIAPRRERSASAHGRPHAQIDLFASPADTLSRHSARVLMEVSVETTALPTEFAAGMPSLGSPQRRGSSGGSAPSSRPSTPPRLAGYGGDPGIPPVPPIPSWISSDHHASSSSPQQRVLSAVNRPPPPPVSTAVLPASATGARALLPPCLDPVSDAEFDAIVDAVRDAIQEDAQPMRIGQGSSGSYFCRNTDGQILGVHKPKDEEPYGELNPKWMKWIHRNVFFCCFGRSCLIPNVGYLSEAGASLLDRRLGFGIVPLTKVVTLSSPAFHYRKKHRRHPNALPLKMGSFQLFLRGFKDASIFFKLHPLPADPPPGSAVWASLREDVEVEEDDTRAAAGASPESASSAPFLPTPSEDLSQSRDEHMASSTEALLGPAASTTPPRGTAASRRADTRIDMPPLHHHHEDEPALPSPATAMLGVPNDGGYEGIWDAATYDSFVDQFQRLAVLDYLMRNTDRGLDNWMIKFTNGRLQVAAIDHGLAFPFKHPDKWRSYPYGWLYLSIAKLPFQPALREYVARLLRDPRWWAVTRTDLYELFSVDEAFDPDIFEAQMAVIRGQMYNLLKCLDARGSPWDLWFRTPIIVVRQPVMPSPRASLSSRARGGTSQSLPLGPDRVSQVANGLRTAAGRGATGAGGYARPGSSLAGTAGSTAGLDDHFHVAGEWIDQWDAASAHSAEGGGGGGGRGSPRGAYTDDDDDDDDEDDCEDDDGYDADGNRRWRSASCSRAGGAGSSSSHSRVGPLASSPNNNPRAKSDRGRARGRTASSGGASSSRRAGGPAGWKPHGHGQVYGPGEDPDLGDRVKAMWDKGKRKVRAGVRRARNVILETKRKPWFHNW
ncbi:Phosphatidylinositol 4-kinase LSB6 [Blastocladiella emersonii ATCC 22665]|nr:Phosphatidylinositol 4-kinase LSB6 [Blastocladiella emersonii ATCC 22665]